MLTNDIFWIFFVLYTASTFWDIYVHMRQYRLHRRTTQRPDHVAGIVTEEMFAQARAYSLDKKHFRFVSKIITWAITSAALMLNGLPWIWNVSGVAARFILPSSGEALQSIAFIGVMSIVYNLSLLPFRLYDTFVIEQRHGFNRQKLPSFLCEHAAKMVRILVGSALFIPALIWIVQNGGPFFFVYVWGFLSIGKFLLVTTTSVFIVPRLYKPLPFGDLRTNIGALMTRVEFPLNRVYVEEGSERTLHSRAYMSGFWVNKRIVLFDTLLSKLNDDEVIAVIGHELGHWRGSHTVWNFLIDEADLLWKLAVFAQCHRISSLYAAFGFPVTDSVVQPPPVIVGLAIVFLLFLMVPYNELKRVALNCLGRRKEFSADEYSARLGFSTPLQRGLAKLASANLHLPIDDWLYSLVNNTHPPILERLEALEKHRLKEEEKDEH